ncbi:hypothetical protein Ciccas_014049, partial [Cichlidogyrus casuarinus]
LPRLMEETKRSIVTNLGEKAQLLAKIDANPPVTSINWYRMKMPPSSDADSSGSINSDGLGETIEKTNRLNEELSMDGKRAALQIDGVSQTDLGTYILQLHHELGSVQFQFHLQPST